MFITHKSLETSVICLLNKLKIKIEFPDLPSTTIRCRIRNETKLFIQDHTNKQKK